MKPAPRRRVVLDVVPSLPVSHSPHFISGLSTKTRTEVLAMKTAVDSDIAALRADIERADLRAAAGELSDLRWYADTHKALQIRGAQSQQLQSHLRDLREQRGLSPANTAEAVKAAKVRRHAHRLLVAHIGETEWARIWKEAELLEAKDAAVRALVAK